MRFARGTIERAPIPLIDANMLKVIFMLVAAMAACTRLPVAWRSNHYRPR